MGRARRAGARTPDRGEQLALPVAEAPAPGGRALREPSREDAPPARGAPPQPQEAKSHQPVILQIGPREFAVLAWLRDEAGAPVYKVVQEGIKAASTAAVMARKIERKR